MSGAVFVPSDDIGFEANPDNSEVTVKFGPAARTGLASLLAMEAGTPAALLALADAYAGLAGVPGEEHVWNGPPYLQTMNIEGRNSIMRNNDTTALNVNDWTQVTFPLGNTNTAADNNLTEHPIAAVSGSVLTLTNPLPAYAAVGGLVQIFGASYADLSVYRNHTYQTRAKILELDAVTKTVRIDRQLVRGLAGDTPVIGFMDEGVSTTVAGTGPSYMLYRPILKDVTLISDLGETMKWGGVIDGRFTNITTYGRNGWALNGAQDCIVDGLRFVAWRKLIEIAQGSVGSTFRNIRGILVDPSTKKGGGSDLAPFFIGIHENSQFCRMVDVQVSSGPNSAGATSNFCQLATGRHNWIEDFVFDAPAHAGFGLVIQSNVKAGNGNYDCGYRNGEIYLPVGNRFFNVGDAGSGIVRPTFQDIKCFGTVSSGHAGYLMGTDGLLDNVWCEAGDLTLNSNITGWTIRNCYFPLGFDVADFTPTIFATNSIYDNDSDANRLANAAALRSSGIITVTNTVANQVWKSASFPAGCLAVGDVITLWADTSASGAGTGGRNWRVSVEANGTVSGIGSRVVTAPTAVAVDAKIIIESDTVIRYQTMIGGSGTPAGGELTVPSISTYGLKVNLELWVASASENIPTGYIEILPRKRGMKQIRSHAR